MGQQLLLSISGGLRDHLYLLRLRHLFCDGLHLLQRLQPANARFHSMTPLRGFYCLFNFDLGI